MAVVQINLNNINLEVFPNALSSIEQAINERLTIIRAFDKYTSNPTTLFNSQWPPERSSPNYAAKLNNMTQLITRMSKYFVDLSAEYIQDSYSNFPKTLEGAMMADAENVFTKNVCVGETFGTETMDNFKAILSNAAKWLNKMVYVVPEKVYTTQYWHDRKSWDDSNPDTLSNETAPFVSADFVETQNGMTIEFDSSLNQWGDVRTGNTNGRSGIRRVTARTGLIVDNKTPYDAQVKNYLVMPFVNESQWNNDDKWQRYIIQEDICSQIWQPYPDVPAWEDDRYPGVRNGTYSQNALIGGTWRHTNLQTFEVEYDQGRSGRGRNWQISAINDEIDMNYNHDGSESIVLDETHEEEGENQSVVYYADPENEVTVYNTRLWYEFGQWESMDKPIETTLSAHSRDYVLPTLSSFPEPEIEWDQFNTEYQRGEYMWSESYSFSYIMRVVPILDFTESITTFSGV